MRKIIIAALVALAAVSFQASAEDKIVKTVEETYAQKAELAGKKITVTGTVVKVNNGIMGKNFLHLRDGSGKEGSNDLTVTSQSTANVDDKVEITGIVAVDRDFGFGYNYPLLVEEASVAPAK